MMTINQSALATAVINITGNTQGLNQALGESRKQMHGFLVFAQAMGGKTGGLLANMLAMGGARPALSGIFGQRVGGEASKLLENMGVMKNPMKDIDAAMTAANAEYRRKLFTHKMTGSNIRMEGVYQGDHITSETQLAAAKARHARDAPKLSDLIEKHTKDVAEPAQNLALFFGRLGMVVNAAVPVFRKLLESGSELQDKMRRTSMVFGGAAGAAMGGFGWYGANMSKSEFASGAAGIGSELAQQGVGGRQSASMSSNLTARAGEMAAAWGGDFADVIGKIQSAVGGSDAALSDFGVVLSEDLVRAKAFNSGMIKLHETMSAGVAAQARYELIMDQTNKAIENSSASFFSLSNQWRTTTSGFSTAMGELGSILAPMAATVLGVTNALAKFMATIVSIPGQLAAKAYNYVVGTAAPEEGAADMGRVKDDAARAEDILRRERARQSSNVGFHAPQDFYNHIQKGIFGDPVAFQRRQADLAYELLIVSKEQLDALRDFGYKVKDGTALLQP